MVPQIKVRRTKYIQRLVWRKSSPLTQPLSSLELCFRVKPEDQGIAQDLLAEDVTLRAGTLLAHRSPALPTAPTSTADNEKPEPGGVRGRQDPDLQGPEREAARQQNPGQRTGRAASPRRGGGN